MASKRAICWLPALALFGSAGGCMFMPKEAGVRLQADVIGLRQELGRVRAAQEQQNAARLEHDQASDAQLGRVQKRLDETSKVAHLAEADMGTQLDRLIEDVQRLHGSLEDNAHRLNETEVKLDQKLNERLEALKKAAEQRDAAARSKKALPRGKKDQLAYAKRALTENRGDEGRAVLRELATRYAKERGVGDEALFALANDAQSSGNPELALRDFVRLLDATPNSARAAEATFRIGQCAQATGRTEDARTFFNEVVTGFPRSPWAAQAKAQLAAAPAAAKGTARPASSKPVPPAAAASPSPAPPSSGPTTGGNAT